MKQYIIITILCIILGAIIVAPIKSNPSDYITINNKKKEKLVIKFPNYYEYKINDNNKVYFAY